MPCRQIFDRRSRQGQGGLWRQDLRTRGKPKGKLVKVKAIQNKTRHGGRLSSRPGRCLAPETRFDAGEAPYRMSRSKAYLFRGVEIRWSVRRRSRRRHDDVPAKEEVFHFPGGLLDFLKSLTMEDRPSRRAGDQFYRRSQSGENECTVAARNGRSAGPPTKTALPACLLQHRADANGRQP